MVLLLVAQYKAHRASLTLQRQCISGNRILSPHVSGPGCVQFLLARLAVIVIPAEIGRKNAQAKDYFGEIAEQETSFPPVTLWVLLAHESFSSLIQTAFFQPSSIFTSDNHIIFSYYTVLYFSSRNV